MNPTATRSIAPVDLRALPDYAPTTYLDFGTHEHRLAFEKALIAVRAQFGFTAPLVIGGEQLEGEGTFESPNPPRPAGGLGRFQSGSKAQAARAIQGAHEAFASWGRVPGPQRPPH